MGKGQYARTGYLCDKRYYGNLWHSGKPVSYTHLDVYKRQGVKVTVVTAADGQYKTTLKSELAKKEAPTIFRCV